MGDKSCYMGAGGYQANTSNGSGYAREDYARGGNDKDPTGPSYPSIDGQPPRPHGDPLYPGTAQGKPSPGVFKARTDQSCYLGPS